MDRRRFLQQGAAVGAGLIAVPASAGIKSSKSPNEKLNVACIGIEGRGAADLRAVSETENIVALCDVDEERLARVGQDFPQAYRETDYRRLADRRDIDAFIVATPDHHHATAAAMALELGKHCYCEKPLTHSVWEARKIAELAKRAGVATQMGNQGHSNNGTRRVVELIRAGVVGQIREAHCWTDRPAKWWPQGIDRPPVSAPPSRLHWDLWLGPAPERPYGEGYHPFKWRGFWDFGTGALGDMACHVMDTAFWGLNLKHPTTVEAWGEPHHPETGPLSTQITYEFGKRGDLAPMKLVWYDGVKRPPADLFLGEKIPDNGTLLIGEKGTILLPDPYGSTFVMLPKDKWTGFTPPPESIPNSIGHHKEWVHACKTGDPTGSNFVYAGQLTEMVLLGNVAFRVGHKIEWDHKKLRVKNCDDAEQYIRRAYRPGWSL